MTGQTERIGAREGEETVPLRSLTRVEQVLREQSARNATGDISRGRFLCAQFVSIVLGLISLATFLSYAILSKEGSEELLKRLFLGKRNCSLSETENEGTKEKQDFCLTGRASAELVLEAIYKLLNLNGTDM